MVPWNGEQLLFRCSYRSYFFSHENNSPRQSSPLLQIITIFTFKLSSVTKVFCDCCKGTVPLSLSDEPVACSIEPADID